MITASGDDMAFTTKSLEVDPAEVDGVKKVTSQSVKVQESKKGEVIRLNDVNFTTNSSLLNSKSMLVLDELVSFLKTKPSMKIEIHGHTDNVGAENKNQTLSEERAKEVMQFLLDYGISPKRVKSKGFGSSRPKVKNSTEINKAINRRVEFVIVAV